MNSIFPKIINFLEYLSFCISSIDIILVFCHKFFILLGLVSFGSRSVKSTYSIIKTFERILKKFVYRSVNVFIIYRFITNLTLKFFSIIIIITFEFIITFDFFKKLFSLFFECRTAWIKKVFFQAVLMEIFFWKVKELIKCIIWIKTWNAVAHLWWNIENLIRQIVIINQLSSKFFFKSLMAIFRVFWILI